MAAPASNGPVSDEAPVCPPDGDQGPSSVVWQQTKTSAKQHVLEARQPKVALVPVPSAKRPMTLAVPLFMAKRTTTPSAGPHGALRAAASRRIRGATEAVPNEPRPA